MKKIVLLIAALLLGAAMFSLNGVFGSWADRLFFRSQVGLSAAFRALEQGRLKDHQKALRDWLIAENKPSKLRAIALYDLGSYSLAAAVKGDVAATRDAFFYFKEALRNDPSLFPAKHNLEILLKSAEEKKAGAGGKEHSGRSQSGSLDDDQEREERSLPVPKSLLGSSP